MSNTVICILVSQFCQLLTSLLVQREAKFIETLKNLHSANAKVKMLEEQLVNVSTKNQPKLNGDANQLLS
jgi:GMP synthase PP-ATPase subunit